jgi:YVTN family beta-propeller protein
MNTYKLARCVIAAGRGNAWKKLPFALMLACLLAPASSRAQNAYITNHLYSTVSVIDTAIDAVIATIPVGLPGIGVVTPDGSKVYFALTSSNTVQVIDTATNTVIATILVGDQPTLQPEGVAVTPDGSKVYAASAGANPPLLSVIDTATNTVSATIAVGSFPLHIYTGTEIRRCTGVKQLSGRERLGSGDKICALDAVAAALWFSTVQGLQDAIRAFCGG